MDEKKLVYQIVLDVWDIAKRYVFGKKLSDAEWEQMIEEANKKTKEYQQKGDCYRTLFHNLYYAIEKYKAERDKEVT